MRSRRCASGTAAAVYVGCSGESDALCGGGRGGSIFLQRVCVSVGGGADEGGEMQRRLMGNARQWSSQSLHLITSHVRQHTITSHHHHRTALHAHTTLAVPCCAPTRFSLHCCSSLQPSLRHCCRRRCRCCAWRVGRDERRRRWGSCGWGGAEQGQSTVVQAAADEVHATTSRTRSITHSSPHRQHSTAACPAQLRSLSVLLHLLCLSSSSRHHHGRRGGSRRVRRRLRHLRHQPVVRLFHRSHPALPLLLLVLTSCPSPSSLHRRPALLPLLSVTLAQHRHSTPLPSPSPCSLSPSTAPSHGCAGCVAVLHGRVRRQPPPGRAGRTGEWRWGRR